MARPKIVIDPEMVLKLASIMCTTPEIAAILNCSEDTIERRFAGILKKGREQGKASLRRHLWGLAQKENLGALIWLSKQHLGMADKVETKQEVKAETKEIIYVAEWGGPTNQSET